MRPYSKSYPSQPSHSGGSACAGCAGGLAASFSVDDRHWMVVKRLALVHNGYSGWEIG